MEDRNSQCSRRTGSQDLRTRLRRKEGHQERRDIVGSSRSACGVQYVHRHRLPHE